MGEADITHKTRMKAIADLPQKVIPEPAFPGTETVVKKKKEEKDAAVGASAMATFRSRGADGTFLHTLYFSGIRDA